MAFGLVPAGTILPFGGATAPSGWLLCNGASVAIASYPALNNAIGVLWGNPGGGSFNLPNLTGSFIRGIGTSGVHVGPTTVGSVQMDQMQGHVHGIATVLAGSSGGSYALPSQYHLEAKLNVQISDIGKQLNGSNQAGATYFPTDDLTNGVPRTGSETRPNSKGVNYIIKI
jgi:microcystin-dependent protein